MSSANIAITACRMKHYTTARSTSRSTWRLNTLDTIAAVSRVTATRPRPAAVLWRFLDTHEECVARSTGVSTHSTLSRPLPSSTPEADESRSGLRTIVGWCEPIGDRYRRVLRTTGDAPPGRAYSEARYVSDDDLTGQRVLLIDDTWTAGGHAQSAGHALREAGASHVGLVVIGRHLRPDWEVTPGMTSGELFNALPVPFDWNTCPVH